MFFSRKLAIETARKGIRRYSVNIQTYETLNLSKPDPYVLHVELNRPQKLNSFIYKSWRELKSVFENASLSPDVRCVILSGAGNHFCSGIDLNDFTMLSSQYLKEMDQSRRCLKIKSDIDFFQSSLSSLSACTKPVIVAVHGACIGAGLDLITAADIRVATVDSIYCVKEVDIGLAADVGTLQRLGKVVGSDSWVREVCLTARNITADEALQKGLLSQVYKDKDELIEATLKLANKIASKSPIAVMGTKKVLNYSRDHSIQEGLEFVSTWNMGMIVSGDVEKCVVAAVCKETPVFEDI